ncbi:mas-related G-protein coupled receptor member H-like [Oenanthe melanoleuca]|uniref:mas-related G-protein coupled receptor member H-like n=1 Tax=Oenanthe melanoleuca TaxID=2939378 RepID=UPI0024C19A0E|nr:mas-related G-protein coupled receptor member H-like [Oenanthe melanoleuca]
MEVSTVSPTPASPTEGDDLCEIDFSSMAIHSVTLLICVCGLAGNGAVLWLLSLKIRNSGIFDLAFADFLFLLFTVPSTLLFLMEDVFCSAIMPLGYLSFLFQLSMVSYYWALFQLAFLNFRKYMIFLFQLCCHCDFPERLWWVLESVQYWAFFSLFIVIPGVTSLCPSKKQEQCRAVLISIYAIILLLFAAPVVISCTIDIIKVKRGSQQKQPETRDIVIFITVLFTLLLGLCNFLQQLGYMPVPIQVVFLFTCIHSSIKPFIYFLAGKCWSSCSMESLQHSLQSVFEEKKETTAGRNDAFMDTGV